MATPRPLNTTLVIPNFVGYSYISCALSTTTGQLAIDFRIKIKHVFRYIKLGRNEVNELNFTIFTSENKSCIIIISGITWNVVDAAWLTKKKHLRHNVVMFCWTDRYLLVLELNNMSKYYQCVFCRTIRETNRLAIFMFCLLLPEKKKHVGFPDKLPYMTWDHEIHEVIYRCMFISCHFMALLEALNSCPCLLTRLFFSSPRVVWQLHRSTTTMCCDPGPITINLQHQVTA